MQRQPMDVGGRKTLHGAVAVRAQARNIAHSDVVGRIKRAGNDGAQLPECSGGVDLTKGVKKYEDINAIFLIFGGYVSKIYGKSHFYATFNWRRYLLL